MMFTPMSSRNAVGKHEAARVLHSEYLEGLMSEAQYSLPGPSSLVIRAGYDGVNSLISSMQPLHGFTNSANHSNVVLERKPTPAQLNNQYSGFSHAPGTALDNSRMQSLSIVPTNATTASQQFTIPVVNPSSNTFPSLDIVELQQLSQLGIRGNALTGSSPYDPSLHLDNLANPPLGVDTSAAIKVHDLTADPSYLHPTTTLLPLPSSNIKEPRNPSLMSEALRSFGSASTLTAMLLQDASQQRHVLGSWNNRILQALGTGLASSVTGVTESQSSAVSSSALGIGLAQKNLQNLRDTSSLGNIPVLRETSSLGEGDALVVPDVSLPNVSSRSAMLEEFFNNSYSDSKHASELAVWDSISLPAVSTTSAINNPLPTSSDTNPFGDFEEGCSSQPRSENLLDAIVAKVKYTTQEVSDDFLSNSTITRADGATMYSKAVVSAGCSSARLNIDRSNKLPDVKEESPLDNSQDSGPSRSYLSSWIEGSHSINAQNSTVESKKADEPVKPNRKRARPGESTRPRPKDRQQIQDRVKELREIVPNGAKCSIDTLLDRTIKHMIFLQSVTKHAEKLKQAAEAKINARERNIPVRNDLQGLGGATWAFELGNQSSMICPIIVEDLNQPGQMLVEMLCEDRGFFLEIADIIRGFGLTILKGVMEARNDKIWAHFIVEATREVTRMDVFMTLVQLLEQPTSSGRTNNQLPDISDEISLLPPCQESPVLNAISSFVERFQ